VRGRDGDRHAADPVADGAAHPHGAGGREACGTWPAGHAAVGAGSHRRGAAGLDAAGLRVPARVPGLLRLGGGRAGAGRDPLVAAFLLELLFGALSRALPVRLRGGPRSSTAALAPLSRFAALRVVAYNLALALFVLAGMGGTGAAALFSALTLGTTYASVLGSLSRVALSLLAFLVLVSFPVVLVTAVRASAQHRRTDPPRPTAAPPAAAGSSPGAGTPLPLGGARPGAGDPPTAPRATGTGTGAALPVGAPTAAGAGAASPAPTGPRPDDGSDRPQMRPEGMDRRALTSVLLGLGSVLGVTALGSALDRAQSSLPAAADREGTPSGAAAAPTGETTTIAVSMAD